MRFLMLNWRDPANPLVGGAERVSLGYLSGLVRRGHEVFWFANAFDEAPRQDEFDGVHVVRSGAVGSSIARAVQWYRRQPPFDLVIDQHHGIPWWAPWWCRTRCLAYVHEVLGPIWSSFYPWPLDVLGQWQERLTHWCYRHVPFWTASAAAKMALLDHGVKHITLIPYGIATQPVAHLDWKPLRPPLRMVVVSRLAPNKRIDHAIQVVDHLCRSGVRCKLRVVGAGQTGPFLKAMVARLKLEGSVEFAGFLGEEEKNRELREAHLLLHTSLREGWGLNILEANAMGTPAVAYPVAGLTEAVRHGETGLLSRNETPEALARTICQLMEERHTYDRLRESAWKRAGAFQWSRILPRACDWLERQAVSDPLRT